MSIASIEKAIVKRAAVRARVPLRSREDVEPSTDWPQVPGPIPQERDLAEHETVFDSVPKFGEPTPLFMPLLFFALSLVIAIVLTSQFALAVVEGLRSYSAFDIANLFRGAY